ncbi:MAG: hypothetical protein OEV14_11285, partial [Gammaproteobacteria bacterium]|nr:hypothetical protein [Gammaproteobacteria bacterium]
AKAAFRITPVQNTRGDLAQIGIPSINELGDLAFSGEFELDGHRGIFRVTGSTRTTIATNDGELLAFGEPPAIDGAGVVTFVADRDDGGRSILSGSGGALTTVARTGMDGITDIVPFVTGNESGEVLFAATAIPGNGTSGRGLYRVQDGIRTLMIAETFDHLVYGPIRDDFAIDNASTIYFENQWSGFSRISQTRTVPFYFDVVTTQSSCAGRVFAAVELLSAGPLGAVFYGSEEGGRRGIYLQNRAGNCATAIADNSGPLDYFPQAAASLDETGTTHVAYWALPDAGNSVIFAGPIGQPEAVIAVGDPLNASTVVELFMGRQAFNRSQQLAFWARLADGTTGVYIAEPESGGGGGGGRIDAPTVLLLAIGAARRWRRQSLIRPGRDRRLGSGPA